MDNKQRLIGMDVTEAAEKLYAELLDEKLRGDRCEWGYGPSCDVAWGRYVERGAHNYSWWNRLGDFNREGLIARAKFDDAFERAAVG